MKYICILTLICLSLMSCVKRDSLFYPDYNAYRVIYCDYDKLTIRNGIETKDIDNYFHDTIPVGKFIYVNNHLRRN